MAIPAGRVFSIPSDEPFLEVLARAVLDGFPGRAGAPPSALELARCRILLPTRRAVRELERIFFDLAGGGGALLPRIAPIGDLDEELLDAPYTDQTRRPALPEALPPLARDFVLFDLVGDWARTNPSTALAAEIRASPHQALALALSLGRLLDTFDTEGVDLARISELFGVEAERHREAILEFLALARERLPERMRRLGAIGAAARRNLLLQREAARLADTPPGDPVIAAGSTGSIPATRALLKAIAGLPRGAVVLPGLDLDMSVDSWAGVGPQHPQFALQQLLADLELTRAAVTELPAGARRRRAWLASETMRPTATADAWGPELLRQRQRFGEALEGVELIEAAHVQDEARAIALILRETLEVAGRSACLATPDRELARRVRLELRRWNIDIDDSAGEPLIRHDGAALLCLAIDTVLAGFAPESLLALLKHPLCRFGRDAETAQRAAGVIELAMFRAGEPAPALDRFAEALAAARRTSAADSHAHPALRALDDADWDSAAAHAAAFAAGLSAATRSGRHGLAIHLDALVQCCVAMAGAEFRAGPGGATLAELLAALERQSAHAGACDLATGAAIIRHYLAGATFRPAQRQAPPLAILGLLEARLARPDRMILGGLNEGRWPAIPDPGPWLNRPMRQTLGLQQPEREIGQTAHDFAQALGCREVYLTWSRRVAGAPAVASRWILRLQMLMTVAGYADRLGKASRWTGLVARLHQPGSVAPCGKPRPRPPAAARPVRIGVSRVETLMRDPYAIYAGDVLRLQPLDDLALGVDFGTRGTVFHAAIGAFLARHAESLGSDALDDLLAEGRTQLAPLAGHPDIAVFWTAQFARVARWLVDYEAERRARIVRVHTELAGRLELAVAGRPFLLTGRADRIDLFGDGQAAILDYKTGAVPTKKQVEAGLSPQLTLEAAMLELGGFAALGRRLTRELTYVKLAAGDPPGVVTEVASGGAMDLARRHLQGLIELLTAYSDPALPYLPRSTMMSEDDVGAVDHLSRYREWALSGDSA